MDPEKRRKQTQINYKDMNKNGMQKQTGADNAKVTSMEEVGLISQDQNPLTAA